MADGRRVGKYLKCHISPTNWPTGTQLGWAHPIMYSTCPPCCGCHGNNRCLATAQLGWSHPIMFPTCPPWCGCHGNGRCLATAQRIVYSAVMGVWSWNLVHNSKLWPQWQSHDQILKFLKFKMADSCHVGKYWKCHNSLPMDRLGRNSGGRIPSCSQFWKCYNSSYDGTDWDDILGDRVQATPLLQNHFLGRLIDRYC